MSSPARKFKPTPKTGAGEVRIIGGQWRRSLLPVPDLPGLRPTPDRVRETLFNWLGQDLTGWHCLDAFAGSGALGFEAASRGAAKVLMVEQHAALVRQLQALKQRLNAEALGIVRGDGLAVLRAQAPQNLDLILLDPPFDSPQYAELLQASAQALRNSGFLYLEAPKAWTDADLSAHGLAVYRHLKAGAVHAHLLRHNPPT